MKPLLLLPFVFLSPLVFPVEVGFNFEEEIVFLEENEFSGAVYTNLDASLFLKYRYFGEKVSLLVYPEIRINENKPYLGFRETLFSLYGDYTILKMGKNNNYFGQGVSYNLFFPMLPVSNVSEKNIYNVIIDGKFSSFAILTGVFADTINIDRYKPPEWYDTWTVFQYSHEKFTAGFEADVLFSPKEDESRKTKLSIEGLFLLPRDINLYGDAAILINEKTSPRDNVSSLAGFSKYVPLSKISMTSIMEISYKENMGYAIYQLFNLPDELSALTGLEGTGRDALRPVLKLQYIINEFKIEINYTGGNLLVGNKNKNSVLFMGICYGCN